MKSGPSGIVKLIHAPTHMVSKENDNWKLYKNYSALNSQTYADQRLVLYITNSTRTLRLFNNKSGKRIKPDPDSWWRYNENCHHNIIWPLRVSVYSIWSTIYSPAQVRQWGFKRLGFPLCPHQWHICRFIFIWREHQPLNNSLRKDETKWWLIQGNVFLFKRSVFQDIWSQKEVNLVSGYLSGRIQADPVVPATSEHEAARKIFRYVKCLQELHT